MKCVCFIKLKMYIIKDKAKKYWLTKFMKKVEHPQYVNSGQSFSHFFCQSFRPGLRSTKIKTLLSEYLTCLIPTKYSAVVFFDQQTGALHTVYCLKSSFWLVTNII